MKKIYTILALSAVVFSCAKNESEQQTVPSSKVDFIGTILEDNTKVTVAQGVSAWEAGDQISVFSVADGSTVGTNVIYTASSAGASTGFTAAADPIAEGDTYYAFSPAAPVYPYTLKAYGDFAGVTEANTPVTDYRYMPIAIDYKQYFTVDPSTGLSVNTTDKPYFYATGTPSGDGQPVELSFEPAVCILEFAIYGTGNLKQFKVEYADESVDKVDQANNVWMTGKGVLNIVDGSLITTNLHSTQYGQMLATLTDKNTGNSYVALSETTPVRLQFVTGRFKVTKGLKLTFNDDKNQVMATKTIWTDKTYTGYNAEQGRCKHIFQPVTLPFLSVTESAFEYAQAGESKTFSVKSATAWTVSEKPEWITLSVTSGARGTAEITATAAANTDSFRSGNIVLTNTDNLSCTITVSQEGLSSAYYTLPLSGIDWTASNVHYAKDGSGNVIAMVTKEFFGYSVNKQGVVVYPAENGTPDYTKGFVAELTLDGGNAVSGNVHGGSISFTNMAATSVSYSEGTSAAATTAYVISGATAAVGEAPAGNNLGTLTLTPLTVVSNVKSHPCTKVGTAIWLAENYKTTKLADGTTDIKTYSNGDAQWSNSSAASSSAVAIWNGEYLYTYWTFGFVAPSSDTELTIDDSRFSPEGWHIPTQSEVNTDMLGFMGNGTNIWTNVCGQGLLNWNLMPIAERKSSKVACRWLEYGSIYTSTAGKYSGASKAWLCGIGEDDAKPRASQQGVANAFCTRLVKD